LRRFTNTFSKAFAAMKPEVQSTSSDEESDAAAPRRNTLLNPSTRVGDQGRHWARQLKLPGSPGHRARWHRDIDALYEQHKLNCHTTAQKDRLKTACHLLSELKLKGAALACDAVQTLLQDFLTAAPERAGHDKVHHTVSGSPAFWFKAFVALVEVDPQAARRLMARCDATARALMNNSDAGAKLRLLLPKKDAHPRVPGSIDIDALARDVLASALEMDSQQRLDFVAQCPPFALEAIAEGLQPLYEQEPALRAAVRTRCLKEPAEHLMNEFGAVYQHLNRRNLSSRELSHWDHKALLEHPDLQPFAARAAQSLEAPEDMAYFVVALCPGAETTGVHIKALSSVVGAWARQAGGLDKIDIEKLISTLTDIGVPNRESRFLLHALLPGLRKPEPEEVEHLMARLSALPREAMTSEAASLTDAWLAQAQRWLPATPPTAHEQARAQAREDALVLYASLDEDPATQNMNLLLLQDKALREALQRRLTMKQGSHTLYVPLTLDRLALVLAKAHLDPVYVANLLDSILTRLNVHQLGLAIEAMVQATLLSCDTAEDRWQMYLLAERLLTATGQKLQPEQVTRLQAIQRKLIQPAIERVLL
jgi:hypothetical protein